MNVRISKLVGTGVVLWLVSFAYSAIAQNQVVLLWPNGAPGSEGKTAEEKVRIYENGEHIVSSVHRPAITLYLPAKDKATGAAVIVIPGGGHRELWMDHEGYNVAQWLSDRGVAAFILKYRLAREESSTYTIEGTELQDIQRAVRTVRSRAQEWGVYRDRIGVIGFSAGGELAALASTRFDSGTSGSADPIERESSKPNFQGLIYPGLPHDMNLSAGTPPAFLACGEDDRPEISQGVPKLYLALKAAGISAELHVYAHAGHGFGLRANNPPPVSGWIQNFLDWMGIQGMLKRK
jgi:endo-1,4-beta-xylanase